MAHFEVGKKVLCVKTHESYGRIIYKKGTIYPLYGIRLSPCKCQKTMLDIGIDLHSDKMYCVNCNAPFDSPGKVTWASSTYFVPLQEDEISDTTIEQFFEEMEGVKVKA